MLKQRVITALVLATFFLGALFFLPAKGFIAVMAVVVVFGGWEWSALAGLSTRASRGIYTLGISTSLVLTAMWLEFDENSLSTNYFRSILSWVCAWWALALLWIQTYPSSALLWGRRWVRATMGFLVLTPTWLALAALVYAPGGAWLVLSVVLLVALADIGAYFSGRTFGKRKLAEQVSPGKTWEGLCGGMAAIAIVVVPCALFLAAEQSQWWAWLLLAGTTGLASVIGDLLESMIKRHRGVKDSGSILPGHGGVLDRIDSLTAALPVYALMYALLYEHLSW